MSAEFSKLRVGKVPPRNFERPATSAQFCEALFGHNIIWPRDGRLHVAKRERIRLLYVEAGPIQRYADTKTRRTRRSMSSSR